MTRRPHWLIAIIIAAGVLLAALAIGPTIWLASIALQKPGRDLNSVSTDVTFANFMAAWEKGRLAGPLINSLLTTVLRAALNVLLAALAAYPLARMTFRGRDTLFMLVLATMMIPDQVILVPLFRIVAGLGMYDTLAALVVPFGVSALGIFMCRQAFLQIPASMDEAARIDGATAPMIWWHIIIPLSAPTLATLALFSIIGAWSDLLWPLVVLQSRHNYTLPVAINELTGVFNTNLRLAYAAAVLALVPILGAFLAVQRWFRPQLFAGAVKG